MHSVASRTLQHQLSEGGSDPFAAPILSVVMLLQTLLINMKTPSSSSAASVLEIEWGPCFSRRTDEDPRILFSQGISASCNSVHS